MIEVLCRRNMMAEKGGGGGGVLLPAGYQQVEYLECTGKQSITLPLDFDVRKSIYKYEMMPIGGGTQGLFGQATYFFDLVEAYKYTIRSGSWNATILKFLDDSFYDGNIISVELTCDSPNYTMIYHNKGTSQLDVAQGSSDYNTDPNTFVLFNIQYYPFKGRIYYFIINELSGTPTFELIPCYRKADFKPGLYDLVNNVFYINDKTGTTEEFIVGPDIV